MINYIKSIFLLLKESNKDTKYIMSLMSGFIFIFLAIIFWNPIFNLIAIIWTFIIYILIFIRESHIVEKIEKRKQELDEGR